MILVEFNMILSKKQTNYTIFQNKERHLFQVEQDFLKMKKVFVHKFLIKNRFHKQAIIINYKQIIEYQKLVKFLKYLNNQIISLEIIPLIEVM